jgi:hypothetical protein
VAQVHYAGLEPSAPDAIFGRWSVPAQVDVREWDGEFVLRSPLTAQTYHVTALAGEVIMAIRDGAKYLDDIAVRVLSGAGNSNEAGTKQSAMFRDNAADMQGLLAVLTELESLGLATADLS